MSDIPTIHIDLSRACANCGDAGALPNGLCLRCAVKLIPKSTPARRRKPGETPRGKGARGQGSLFKGGKA